MFVGISLPLFQTTMGCLSSDIIDGICISWGVSSYATPFSILTITYLMPLMMMLFCYTRIVYKIQRKVTLDLTTSNFYCTQFNNPYKHGVGSDFSIF